MGPHAWCLTFLAERTIRRISYDSCVCTYLLPLSERENKDAYASFGYLPVEQRTKLLTEWHPQPLIKAALDKARPEIERLQRSRDETALSPRDQRYMPSNISEAMLLASRDEEEAEAARRSSSYLFERRSRATNTRGAHARQNGQRDLMHDKPTAALAPSSPIRKRRGLLSVRNAQSTRSDSEVASEL